MHEFVLRIYLMNFKTFLTEFTTRFYTKKLINGHMQKHRNGALQFSTKHWYDK